MIAGLGLENLCVARGGRRLFEGLSLDLRAGEAVALTGANGAGKTSLLRVVAGLLPPEAGAVCFTGTAGGLEPDEARVNGLHLIGHHDGLKTTRTAGEELRFWAAWCGAGPEGAARAVEALTLEPLLPLEVRKLSAGQRRRLALARLVAAPRPLWLLDEPMAPLDAMNRQGFAELMQAHMNSGGMILAAVHDPLPIAARIVALELFPPLRGKGHGLGGRAEGKAKIRQASSGGEAENPTMATPGAAPYPQPLPLEGGGGLFRRELSLAWGRGGGPLQALAFFAGTATLLPLAAGPDPQKLAAVAPGAAFTALALASLLALERLFERDFEDGALDLLSLGALPLEAVCALKCLAQWIAAGLPLALLAPIIAIALGATPALAPIIAVSALLAGLAFVLIGGVGAALALGARRGGLLIAVIVLPLYAPPVIFGAGAIHALADGLPWTTGLLLLAAYSLAAAALTPFAMAAACRNALG